MKNIQVKNSILRKPEWLKIKRESCDDYALVAQLVEENGLHTICSSGKCPNKNECWNRGTATFMILGNICTRACKFCATATGKPLPVDENEPQKVANSIKIMKLKHAVITSVDRDDLPDGGAEIWAKTVLNVREKSPTTTVELLVPDFDGKTELLDIVIDSKPDILGHNIECVRRVTPETRSRAKYDVSLGVIKYIAESGIVAKSGIMLGVGETDEEVIETLSDLKAVGCRIVTIGQYLQPSSKHLPVSRYVHPDKFEELKQIGLEMGFDYIESGPLVRSSYMADKAISSCKKRVL
ncbi:MAG: lipoyl synthase [bacterium]